MNTEHTNQSSKASQAEPVPHSPIDLQSIPDRQRCFTAENIRDIAHDCIRIGDNDQAAVVFAIADALRDGSLVIQPPAQQQAVPVARDVIAKLVALTSAVNIAMDDSEERDGADGCEYVIDRVNFDAVCNALDALEELPDNRPGWAMSAADKAAWALRHLTDAAPQAAMPDDVAKDAARYRWLRQDESEFSSMAPTELDAAIDKAIAAAQKGGA